MASRLEGEYLTRLGANSGVTQCVRMGFITRLVSHGVVSDASRRRYVVVLWVQ